MIKFAEIKAGPAPFDGTIKDEAPKPITGFHCPKPPISPIDPNPVPLDPPVKP